MGRIHRRDLIVGGAIAALGGCARDPAEAKEGSIPEPVADPRAPGAVAPQTPTPPPSKPLPTRTLGKTGEQMTILGLGGQGILESQDYDAAFAVVDRAFALGIRYFDTAWSYVRSEEFLGQALEGRRDQVYVATKCGLRDGAAARTILERSLTRLRTNRIDLWQIHDIRTMNEVNQILAPNGILATAIAAKEEGLIRHIGISGHSFPAVLEHLLDVYPFDTVLMSLNAADSFERPFRSTLLPKAVEKGTGIIGMKVLARGAVLGAITVDEAMHWVLSLPVHGVIVAADTVAQVEQNVAAAQAFAPLTQTKMTEIETRALGVGDPSTFFRRGIWAAEP